MSRNLAHVSSTGDIYLALNGLLVLDINRTSSDFNYDRAYLSIIIGSWAYPLSQVELKPFEPWIDETEKNSSLRFNKS